MSHGKNQSLALSTEKTVNAVHHLIWLHHLVRMALEELGELAEPEIHRERAEVLLALYVQESRSDIEFLDREFADR